MADPRIALTLMFASDDKPSIVATRVGEVVAAEVASPLVGMNWTDFDLDEDDTDDEPDWEAIAKEREAERDEAQATVARVRAESARIRAITRTWEPVADLIDAALDGTIREQPDRPTHPDGTPYSYHEIVAEGWGYCDGCRLWTTGTVARPHQCAETYMQAAANPVHPA
jgi:hypothetical protein